MHLSNVAPSTRALENANILKYVGVVKMFFFLAALLPAMCAFSTQALQKYQERNFSQDDDFSHISVHDIAEDKNGFIWLATQLGLVKFDGYTFTSYEQDDDSSRGLSNNFVYDLEIVNDTGKIWIATASGINLLETKTNTFIHFSLPKSASKEDKVVNTIHRDKQGVIWAGTESGLYKLDKNENFVHQTKTVDPFSINDITSDKDGNLLLATSAGIQRFNPAKEQIEQTFHADLKFLSLFIDKNNAIWAGSNGNGLFYLKSLEDSQAAVYQQKTVENGLASNIVNRITSTQDNTILAATGSGLSMFPDSQFDNVENFEHTQINSDDKTFKNGINALSVFVNSSGYIFCGTQINGFSIIYPGTALFSQLVAGNSPITFSVTTENDNSLWLANESGVYNVDGDLKIQGPYLESALDPAKEKSHIKYVFFSASTNTLWGGSTKGLTRFSKATQSFDLISFENKRVYTINEDESGNLWIGTTKDGLYKYSQESLEILGHWPMPQVFRILPMQNENVWVATIDGLYLIDIKTGVLDSFKSDPEQDDSLPFDSVTWIDKAGENQFVIGTHSKGIATMTFNEELKKPSFKPVLKNSVLSTMPIGVAVKDINNNFWVTTIKGLARTNESFTKVDYFDETDGASSNGYFIGGQTQRNQRLYFAGLKGLTHFHPDDIKKTGLAPELQFTKIMTLGRNTAEFTLITNADLYKENTPKPHLTLMPDDILVNIEFSALEYGAPGSILYRYKLEGFHYSWQQTTSDSRIVTFTSLEPGQYRFDLESTNRYGEWTGDIKSLDITVLAPWWKTNAAIVLYFVVFFSCFALFYVLRMRGLKQRSAMLKAMVDKQTTDLEEANKELSKLLNLDPLTNIYNRRGFKMHLDEAHSKFVRHKETFAIILIDVDHFKHINDSYGHDIGDECLMFLAKLVNSKIRKHDILARWGGEEFILLLPCTNLLCANIVAEKIRGTIAKTKAKLNGHELKMTVSGGISVISEDKTIEACIKQADTLLYEAKKAGRNQFKSPNI